ncbi:transglycosylase domain-containing protein [Sutcliffiella rhizosphaerae]|uniref:Penicillin-binding protein 2D n=1 Tax=Sutcliffiella rhizosphaerae TaxID=2880967 RepID=A0ABM8YJH6_9BACI|nr:PBP1A family penicillin-binding protein [Sutcliffiella rhizosphaerae]CAG9620088.1 Penicillin-binding protein 2D [Sutcliffiella rhizosphaerae]
MELMTNDRFQQLKKVLRAAVFIGVILSISFFLLIGGVWIYAKSKGAPPLSVTQSSIIYSKDGAIIGEAHSGEKRYWVELDDISPFLIDATVAVEDRRFFSHHGFDPKRIVGALLADIKARSKVQGASTISQQYARNLFLVHDKTWKRKLEEALYTIRIEANYSKEEILEGYLNTIYYGHGAYGIEAASYYYFNKPAKDLSLSEASMIAGIPKGPSVFSPFSDEDRALSRQKVVLQSMVDNGSLTKDEAAQALEKPLVYGNREHLPKEYMAPYFQDAVRAVVRHELGLQKELEMGGLHIYTTLDANLQAIAEEEINNIFNPESDMQVGFVAMEPKTGRVLALVGGRNYEDSPYNRVTQAERQPGSTFKPLLYYRALEEGFTPSTGFRSEVTTFQVDEGRSTYTPHNFNNYYANDLITMMQALPLSDNVYAVKTHLLLGEKELTDQAIELGIDSKIKPVPSLALGTSPVRVLDMANAYSMFANGGKEVQPVFIEKIVNYRGEILFEREKKTKQLLDPDVTFVLNHMMTGTFDPALNGYMAVTGNSIREQLTRPYAGKSGSTETDSWMIGYTPQLVSAVWTGYDREKSITLTAEKHYAKDVWASFMERALEKKSVVTFAPTDGVIGVSVNPQTGLLATSDCPVSRMSFYLKGTEPTEYCMAHLKDIEEDSSPTEPNLEEAPKKWWRRLVPWL